MAPRRTVEHGDALAFLRAAAEDEARATTSVVASLPDVSEVGIALPAWRSFFGEAAQRCLAATGDAGITVFFQTDIKVEGRWVSKAGMVLAAAEALDVPLLFHKVVCRRPPGLVVQGRPGYSHLLAFSRTVRDDLDRTTPDVLPDLGVMPWSHSMGTRAADAAMRTVRALSPTTTRVLVPFCGIGTALAMANHHGFDAIGVERKRKRAEEARTFELPVGWDDLRAPRRT